MHIPASRDDVTPAWLSHALAEAGFATEIRAIDIADGSAGRGFACQVLRLTPDYLKAPPGAPKQLIAKLPRAANQEPAAWAANEILWYRGRSCPIRIPACYWSAIDATHTHYCLLLEDLNGLDVLQQSQGASTHQALAAVRVMATLHGTFWGAFDEQRAAAQGSSLRAALLAGWDAFVSLHEDLLSDELLRGRGRLVESIAGICEQLQRNCGTVIHGDFKLDNLLFGKPDSRDAVVVLDWQGVGTGAATAEFAGFLQASLTTDVRASAETQLLAAYHQGLRENGVHAYSSGNFLHDYKLALLVNLAAAIGGCPSIASGRWSGGDARRDRQIRDYSRMTFERRIASVHGNRAMTLL